MVDHGRASTGCLPRGHFIGLFLRVNPGFEGGKSDDAIFSMLS